MSIVNTAAAITSKSVSDTIEQLLQLFETSSGSQFTSDKVMLSK